MADTPEPAAEAAPAATDNADDDADGGDFVDWDQFEHCLVEVQALADAAAEVISRFRVDGKTPVAFVRLERALEDLTATGLL